MLDRFSLRTLAWLSVGLTTIALVVGFAIDCEGFAGNLLAEIAGVLVGLLLAIFLVEKILDRERQDRWNRVAEQTMKTLRFALIRASTSVYLSLPTKRPPKADPYTLGLLGDNRLTDALHALAGVIRADAEFEDEEQLLDGMKSHLDLIRGGIMPQLLAIGEHDLVAELAGLEGAFQDLENTVWLQQRFGGPNRFNENLATVIDSLAAISSMIEGQ